MPGGLRALSGVMRLRVLDDGRIWTRSARNIVVRQGAEIVARLFSGEEGSIDTVCVGFGREVLDTSATALTPHPDPGIAVGALTTPIAPDAFTLDTTSRDDAVVVAIASPFTPTVELEGVTEAGLIAGGRLYNQVVFEPISLRPGQDVTFFWEIAFPFGR